jgi:hypothetical protein
MTRRTPRARRRRAGQTLIFMVLILVILLVVALWQFDLHKIIYVKHISRNAGDAAALAAARWQGITMNLIGELNVMQAVAITESLSRGETVSRDAEAIAELQARLNFVGPLVGFTAAQQAAKNNGLYANDDFTDRVLDHVSRVRGEYPHIYPDPYPATTGGTAWNDYAQMLSAIAGNEIAVYPENAQFFWDYANSAHYLLEPSFYDAISSTDWCWFLFNALSLLRDYSDWEDWPPLPLIQFPEPINSEYFGLHLRRVSVLEWLAFLDPNVNEEDIREIIRQIRSFADEPVDTRVAYQNSEIRATWYCYQPSRWANWTASLPAGFPFIGDIREPFDYTGADAAILVETPVDSRMPGGRGKTISWTAAAKPFGFLDNNTPPHRYGLVLPAFHEARLIPVDTSSASQSGSRPGWGIHIRYHLPPYTARGLDGLTPGCWYCNQLRTWEVDAFRDAGLEWLEVLSYTCLETGGPGGGPGGGTRRGH